MKIALPLSILVIASVLFAGCIPTQTAPRTDTVETTTEKQGNTTKTGTISEAGGQYYLNQPGQPLLHLDSYSVDFSQYVGQNVTVTGQYSGETLFVDQIN